MDQPGKCPPDGSKVWKRCLLVLDPDLSLRECSEKLKSTAWCCQHATSAAQALVHLQQHDISVAVAAIHSGNQQYLAKEIALIQRQYPQIHWLAITDNTLDQRCSWLLSANFIDYYHHPWIGIVLPIPLGICGA
ncbi:hypothetical protein KHX94_01830 [Shewanella dokdonensis]|uniref:VpsR domain-containing protein n=1 Tax=Shewanella dokdonensis TaxID=712036 RepID=A0ABX8DFM2_9GAMM|nr:VpsR-related response regulator [Shewanella dokdonensis]QVK23534.1 hypothetical protein KHX94_01830 [Shewanella dokdonensis]